MRKRDVSRSEIHPANPVDRVRRRIDGANLKDYQKRTLNGLLDDLVEHLHFSQDEAAEWIGRRIETREELASELDQMEKEVDALFRGSR